MTDPRTTVVVITHNRRPEVTDQDVGGTVKPRLAQGGREQDGLGPAELPLPG